MGNEYSYSKGIGGDSIPCILHQQGTAWSRDKIPEDGKVGVSVGHGCSETNVVLPSISNNCDDLLAA